MAAPESYACKNGPAESFFDGLGMGLGFSLSLTVIGMCRELIGAGAVFGHVIIPEQFHISIMILAPGALFTLAMLSALQNKLRLPSATNGDAPRSDLACGGDCLHCSGCTGMTEPCSAGGEEGRSGGSSSGSQKGGGREGTGGKKGR